MSILVPGAIARYWSVAEGGQGDRLDAAGAEPCPSSRCSKRQRSIAGFIIRQNFGRREVEGRANCGVSGIGTE